MGNEDLTNCIPWYCIPQFKCEDIQDGIPQGVHYHNRIITRKRKSF